MCFNITVTCIILLILIFCLIKTITGKKCKLSQLSLMQLNNFVIQAILMYQTSGNLYYVKSWNKNRTWWHFWLMPIINFHQCVQVLPVWNMKNDDFLWWINCLNKRRICFVINAVKGTVVTLELLIIHDSKHNIIKCIL